MVKTRDREAQDVTVTAEEGTKVLFTLAEEVDEEESAIDLTRTVAALIQYGALNHYAAPEDSVPFGTVSIDGLLVVTVNGRSLEENEIHAAIESGFVNAIHRAIDAIHELVD